MWTSKRSKNLQSSRPRLAIDSPRELAKRKGAPPGADRSPAAMGELESSLRVTCGTQHVINQDGPEHPSSLIPPFIQHITVSVQLSQSPSVNTNSSIGNEFRSISGFLIRIEIVSTHLRCGLRLRWIRTAIAGSSWNVPERPAASTTTKTFWRNRKIDENLCKFHSKLERLRKMNL